MLIGAAQQKGVDLPSIKNQLNFRLTAADAGKKYEDWERRVGQLEDLVYSYFYWRMRSDLEFECQKSLKIPFNCIWNPHKRR